MRRVRWLPDEPESTLEEKNKNEVGDEYFTILSEAPNS